MSSHHSHALKQSNLHIFQSPDLTVLAEQFFQCYQASEHSVFDETLVIVPNLAMRDWLEQRLARRDGISARIRFPLWLEFQHGLIESVYMKCSENSGAGLLPMSDAALRWTLFAYLLQQTPMIFRDETHVLHVQLQRLLNETALVQGGLTEGQIQRLWAYAEETARIFTGYISMRPHWLRAWAGDEAIDLADFVDEQRLTQMPDWLQHHYREVLSTQRFIWRELFAESSSRHDEMYRFFCMQAECGELPDIPSALFIFTLPTLNRQMLEFLQVLSQAVSVYIFHYSVSNQYFPDVVDSRWLRQLSVKYREYQHRSSGHELVSRFGKNHRERLRLFELVNLSQEMILLDKKPVKANTLLSRLQDDIARMDDAITLATHCDDDSLRIHACHGLLRQLEILRGELVRWLNADSSRKVDDILIVLPDIEAKQAVIRAVFPNSGAYDGYRLPVRLTGTATPETDNLWQAVGGIYALADGDFDVQSVSDWLLLQDNCHAYGIGHEEMFLVLQQLKNAGFRRGFDEMHLKTILGMDDGDYRYTFCYALDRLVAGYAMPSVPIYDEHVVPMLAINQQYLPALEVLCRFGEDIQAVQAERGQMFDAVGALEKLRQRLYERYVHSANTQAYQIIDERIQDVFYQLVGNAQLAYGKQAPSLPMRFVVRTVGDSLSGQRVSSEPSGVITIGSLSALRNLPYKLIVFAGAEDGKFPAKTKDRRYDLIDIAKPELGDKSCEQDDLSAFLDMLSLAQENCWIFYTVVEPNDGEPHLPPAPVQELLKYLEKHLPTTGVAYHINHESDPFHPDASSTHPAPLWQKVRKNMQQNQTKNPWTSLDFPNNWREQELKEYLTKEGRRQVIPFAQIIQTLQKPASAFLREQDIRLSENVEDVVTFEPLEATGLEKWKIDDEILRLHDRQGKSKILQALPLLPVGNVGKLLAQMHEKDLVYRRKKLLAFAKCQKENIVTHQQITIACQPVSAYLPAEKNQDWLRLHLSKNKAKYGLAMWLEHLLWQCQGGQGKSIISFKDEIKIFAPVKQAEAKQMLEDWLSIYVASQNHLYLLAPALVETLLQNERAKKPQSIIKKLSDWRNQTYLEDEPAWRFVLQGYDDECLAQKIERIFHSCQSLYLPVWDNIIN